MIAVSKSEKEAIIKQFPNAYMVRTVKHKSKRHRYYCEESPKVLRYLDDIRSGRVDGYQESI